jgi:mannose/cellobiose epimerase-like protein (N-acyl-D-glucosamine 2-epimerase family)
LRRVERCRSSQDGVIGFSAVSWSASTEVGVLMSLKSFNQAMTVAGKVISIDETKPSFSLRARSGDVFEAMVGSETYYSVVTNLDNLDRDRVPEPQGIADGVLRNLHRYAVEGRPMIVEGIYQQNDGKERFEARNVYLLHSDPKRYMFEETHWWPTQTTQMADRILDHLFDARRSYTIDDFSKFYRTNLNVLGERTDETVQECAVLSRLLYDLSSAYLMTGAERYLLAARAAADYLREAFRSLNHDGRYCFWAYGRRRNIQGEHGEAWLFASRGPDDVGTVPLYEQIYALAGLTQFYRITLEWEILEDIRRTINSFQDFFWDPPEATSKGFAGKRGYYSHLDPATMRPETMRDGTAAAENRSRKNWNSVGDHIPAYLVNLILSLEPLPRGAVSETFKPLLDVCHTILEEVSELICDKFPDPNSDYVFERFHADWTPDLGYRWQQNRAVVGHNLKIAWNLTRCAYYFQTRAKWLRDHGKAHDAADYDQRSDRCLEVAKKLADRMGEVGLDKIRGGIYDAVERNPTGGMPTQFAWGTTKDFWQQEQGILAYLILHGATGNPHYLQLARECSAFWNVFFLDREHQGYFFRTTENGLPILSGQYGMRSSHAIGYHAFELAYLAHLYTRAYVSAGPSSDNSFCLYFKISSIRDQTSINVLPDFMPPGCVQITSVIANGVNVTDKLDPAKLDDYQIPTNGMPPDPKDGTVELVIEFRATPVEATSAPA